MEATGGSEMLVLTCHPKSYRNVQDHSLNPYLHESLKSRIKKLSAELLLTPWQVTWKIIILSDVKIIC